MASTTKQLSQLNRLTEGEVKTRLLSCTSGEVLQEVYDFGQSLLKETVDRVKALETKASSFAAYGIAVVTLLVSSSASWEKLGGSWSLWIAACAAICGLACTGLCVSALRLDAHSLISQEEWLEPECLSKGDMAFLQKYRVLTMWGAIDSYTEAQARKAKKLMQAESWLAVSTAFLVFLLLELAWVGTGMNVQWLTFWHGIHGHHWFSFR